MEVEDQPEHVDQIEECFVDHEWVKVYGLGAHNALDYFACSQFYEVSCNNEILKMQRRDLSSLKSMKGIEYVLDRRFPDHEPFLFLIVKQNRLSETEVNSVARYYILDKVIYESPSLKALFKSRISAFNFHATRALNFLQDSHKFSPLKGHYWEFKNKEHTVLWNSKRDEFNKSNTTINAKSDIPFEDFVAIVDKVQEGNTTQDSE